MVKLYQEIESVSQDHSREQLRSARDNGCTVGGYVFGYAGTNPVRTVLDVVGLAQAEGVSLPVLWIDVESYEGEPGPDVEWIRDAVSECNRLGIRPGIYTGRWYWDAYLPDVTEFSHLPLWLAEYDNDPNVDNVTLFGGWNEAAGKQFTSTPVDQNVFRPQYTMIGGPAMPELTPSIKDEYSDLFNAWWHAGGWMNFGTYIAATGAADVPDYQFREFLRNRLDSVVNEVKVHLDR